MRKALGLIVIVGILTAGIGMWWWRKA